MCATFLKCVRDFWNVWEFSEMCERFLECVGDLWNVWEIFLSLQVQLMLTEIQISLVLFFTCLMDHNSCGRITVF
jgi:hypothetical protein